MAAAWSGPELLERDDIDVDIALPVDRVGASPRPEFEVPRRRLEHIVVFVGAWRQ